MAQATPVTVREAIQVRVWTRVWTREREIGCTGRAFARSVATRTGSDVADARRGRRVGDGARAKD